VLKEGEQKVEVEVGKGDHYAPLVAGDLCPGSHVFFFVLFLVLIDT
jgi:hypothetical protein